MIHDEMTQFKQAPRLPGKTLIPSESSHEQPDIQHIRLRFVCGFAVLDTAERDSGEGGEYGRLLRSGGSAFRQETGALHDEHVHDRCVIEYRTLERNDYFLSGKVPLQDPYDPQGRRAITFKGRGAGKHHS